MMNSAGRNFQMYDLRDLLRHVQAAGRGSDVLQKAQVRPERPDGSRDRVWSRHGGDYLACRSESEQPQQHRRYPT